MNDNETVNNILEANRGKAPSQAEQMIRLLKTQLEEAKAARKDIIEARQNAQNGRLNFLTDYKLKLQVQDAMLAQAQKAEQDNLTQIRGLLNSIAVETLKGIK